MRILVLFFTFYRLIKQMTTHLFTQLTGTVDLEAQTHSVCSTKISFGSRRFSMLLSPEVDFSVKSALRNLRHRLASANREIKSFPMSVFIDSSSRW